MTKILIWLLTLDAAAVFVMQMARLNAWPLVCLYWLILTAKNAMDVR